MMEHLQIQSFDSLSLTVSVVGAGDKGSVVLAHGGGQTRHSWAAAGDVFAKAGYLAVLADLRGHGDSGWAKTGIYSHDDFAKDSNVLAAWAQEKTGKKPHYIGASLGGVAGLIAEGSLYPASFASLTLVDVTPRVKAEGFASIISFMKKDMVEGFKTIEDAAESIAAYMPNRKSPPSVSGLKKNLKLGGDGRWRWHWDPSFLETLPAAREELQVRLEEAARNISIPMHLIKGRESELVSDIEVAHFRTLLPEAAVTDIAGAGHMVAGDRNDVFVEAALKFIAAIG
ncbi:MAG: alpha/beta hydrolase [Kordiimonadaceae bacterium]|nr:alpha/beta hydrolase [Kordiimonadaceae bacterium]